MFFKIFDDLKVGNDQASKLPADIAPTRIIDRRHPGVGPIGQAETPETANDRLEAFRTLFAWAVAVHQAPRDVAAEVRKLPPVRDGFATWTDVQIAAFEARHPIGTKARLAFALFLYAGQRRSGVVRFGRQHVSGGALRFAQLKGRKKKPRLLVRPILPALQDIIERSPCGDLAFLVTEFGKPFTVAGFGDRFRDRCDEAGLKGIAGHGLRKAVQAIGAEDGLADRELRRSQATRHRRSAAR